MDLAHPTNQRVRAAIIGAGSIGRYLINALRQERAGPVDLVAVADRPEGEPLLAQVAGAAGCPFVTEPLLLNVHHPDIVIEAASQDAVRRYAVAFLEEGTDVMLMSVGALADPQLLAQVSEAARARGRRVYLPSGAVGGLDVLRAASLGGLEEVMLTSSKPPAALAGAPFFEEQPWDLASIRQRTVLYDGVALEAVRLFPANVNVAAAVSLAGLGPASTRVRVVADPSIDRNVHELEARGTFGEMHLWLSNLPSDENPKTSLLACLSAVATLRKVSEPIQIG